MWIRLSAHKHPKTSVSFATLRKPTQRRARYSKVTVPSTYKNESTRGSSCATPRQVGNAPPLKQIAITLLPSRRHIKCCCRAKHHSVRAVHPESIELQLYLPRYWNVTNSQQLSFKALQSTGTQTTALGRSTAPPLALQKAHGGPAVTIE